MRKARTAAHATLQHFGIVDLGLVETGTGRPQRQGEAICPTAWLREVSDEVNAAYGLYRVEAGEGFNPSKVYDIVYRDGGRHLTAELRMAKTPLNMDGQTPFTVGVDGAARREKIRMARGGSCDMLVTLASQPLRLALPPAYEAYPALLMYFMQEKLEQRDRQQFSAAGRFTAFRYWPTV